LLDVLSVTEGRMRSPEDIMAAISRVNELMSHASAHSLPAAQHASAAAPSHPTVPLPPV